MTNREILAELKRSYEYLYDIIENGSELHCDGQMKKSLIEKLEKAKYEIEEVYHSFWKEIYKNDSNDLKIGREYDDGDVLISDEVTCDYLIFSQDKNIEDTYVTCGDLDYYWYQDEDFIDE